MTYKHYKIFDSYDNLVTSFILYIRNTEEKIHLATLLMKYLEPISLETETFKVRPAIMKAIKSLMTDDEIKKRHLEFRNEEEYRTTASFYDTIPLRRSARYMTADFLYTDDIEAVEELFGIDVTETPPPLLPREMCTLYDWENADKILGGYMNNADSYLWEHPVLSGIYFSAEE